MSHEIVPARSLAASPKTTNARTKTPEMTIVLAALIATPIHAEVQDAAANGFTVTNKVTIAATRQEAYKASIEHISQWWSSDHTISGDAANLFINAEPGGCFCERLGNNGGLIHLVVTFVNPGVMLRLSGGLGPLGLMGVNGNLTWEFESSGESGEETVLTWTYAVGGYLDGGLDSLAPAVDGVLREQLISLKHFVESGA